MKRMMYLIFTLFMFGCNGSPKLTICISDPKPGGVDCHNARDGKDFFSPYSETDKYVFMPPGDAQTYFTWCAQKGHNFTGPQVTVCLSEPAISGMTCFDPRTGQNSLVHYLDTDKYVGMNPIDFKTYTTWCAQ